ncbi:sensor histidine kinase [Paenibacillus sp. LHD-38]|uniref:sensor histidine kinase n=1 Tax=Paenibacillus sp. LHD-38 TaxID=3072143 RepID=UPI00280D3B64|nr:sensor histidine kinase [Paenibacillus sp. LHD-38]MDQ8738999.1 sensor histidine kinase [Paenibacillus sp. LHD-38]
MKVRTKIFAANALVGIILLGLLTYYMSGKSSNIILSNTEEEVGRSVSQLSQNIDNLLQSYEQVVDSLYTSTELQDKLLRHYDSFAEAQETYLNYVQPYEEWITTSKDILRFSIYTDNPTFQYAQVRTIDEEIKQSNWYRSVQGPKAGLVKSWTASEEDALLRHGVLRLTQKVFNTPSNQEMYVTLDLEDRLLRNLISSEGRSEHFIIALPDGSVLIDTQRSNSYPARLADYNFYEDIATKPQLSTSVSNYEGQDYLLTSISLQSRGSVNGLTIVRLTPLDQITVQVNDMKRSAIMLFILAVLSLILLIYLISNRLTNRLTVLAKRMRTVGPDNMDSLSRVQVSGNDEISELYRHFNEMMDRINQLIKEVYESELNRKELKLRNQQSALYALQTQINPHYLFNTLNAICGSLLEKGDRANAVIVKLLAQSFRNVLSRAGDMISLKEEMEIVDTYLRIQAFRFDERLVYDSSIPKLLAACEIPRLSLQTVVENAIVHVLEKVEDVTVVAIYARVIDGNRCIVTVEDNGPGMSAEQLREIKEAMNNASDWTGDRRIGLRNVHQRLRLMFGDPYGLSIESEPGSGTMVSIILPLNEAAAEGRENHVKCFGGG